jgi:uncharacterized protein involved in cysteine biosynthesis
MTLQQQLKEAFFYAPLSLVKIRKNAALWLCIYLITGLVIFSFFTWLMLSNQESIKNAFLSYLFPHSWHEIAEDLVNFLYESQAKSVLGNLILSGSLVVSSMFLFPIKEKYSAEFEKDANYQNGKVKEFPLIFQAWEEIKLFLIYLTAQSIILWIGYYPYQWATWTSITLSYLFLFFTFGLDFIAPTFQRHRKPYTLILKTLLKKPLLVLSFGLVFSLPIILISQYIFSIEELTLIEIASILFLTNLLFLTLAVPAGTRVATSLFSDLTRTLRPSKKTVIKGYSLMAIILVAGLFLHGKLITSMHHKSQLLKAQYSVDWDSFEYDTPSLSQFFNGKALTNLSFDITIKNPTDFDIIIEQSQILVDKKNINVATIDLTGFEIPAGESRQVTMKLDSDSDLSKVTNFREILDDWRVDMHLELLPGIPFIFNIVAP